jgi:hypothetical protein
VSFGVKGMILKQLSVFIENAPGRLHEVTSILAEAGINLRALTLVDKGDFGVLFLLVPDVNKAREMMTERQIPSRVDEVVAAEIEDKPGSLAAILKPLGDANVNVQYMYAFVSFHRGRAIMIFHFSDNEKAIGVLRQQGIRVLDAETVAFM